MAKKKVTKTRGKASSQKKSRRVPKNKKTTATRRAAKKSAPSKASRKKTVKKPSKSSGRSSASIENQIKKLDGQLLALINDRAAATTKWIESQPNPQKALFAPRNDDDLWQRLAEENPGPLPAHAVRAVFRHIISAARRKVKTLRVAYLGPAFSFTHLAAIERFGEMADLYSVSTIASVFEEVNRANANYGIVPIENSTDGRIIDTLGMFQTLPLRITGEVKLQIRLNLLAKCPRGEISMVFSKPQALSQCREWLARNIPQAQAVPVTSTSAAADLARTKQGAGAIASELAAVEYGLDVVAADIQDNPHNVTRFAVIGDESPKRTGRDRTSILVQIPDKPGSLADILAIFKKAKINLSWIESFPVKGPEKGYQFFLDLEGHVTDAKVKSVLSELEKKAIRIVLLGSYPQSETFA